MGNSRRCSFAACSAALLAALWGCGSGAGTARPRNAILISIDTLRPDHLGCYGHARDTSPTLDALAAAGVRFEDVTAAAPWTLPSHASMLTGLYPSRHGVTNHEERLPERIVTLAEELRDEGFETFAVVNTHNVGAPGFQLWQGFGEARGDGADTGRFRYIIETEDDPKTMKLRTFNNGDTIVSTAKELLRARDEDRPFFLFLHFYDVHTDFTPRAEYRERFVGPYSGRLTGSTSQLVSVRNGEDTLSAADLRWLREMYDAEIRQLDDLLGRFFAWLEDEGLADGTLFVVTSDHGEEFQEHGSVLHGRTQYQEVLRIPLLVKGPGVPAGKVVSAPVHGVDVTPTILAVLGIASRTPRDGLDLTPAWSGGTLPERLLFGEADHNNRVEDEWVYDIKKMVRQGHAKLLLDRLTGRLELYDLERDRGEQDDVADERPELVGALKAELERFLAGAVEGEAIPPPTEEERRRLEALGYN
jgi:arylsulfatase A-like enzyme